jgi:hypothetical protein
MIRKNNEQIIYFNLTCFLQWCLRRNFYGFKCFTNLLEQLRLPECKKEDTEFCFV